MLWRVVVIFARARLRQVRDALRNFTGISAVITTRRSIFFMLPRGLLGVVIFSDLRIVLLFVHWVIYSLSLIGEIVGIRSSLRLWMRRLSFCKVLNSHVRTIASWVLITLNCSSIKTDDFSFYFFIWRLNWDWFCSCSRVCFVWERLSCILNVRDNAELGRRPCLLIILSLTIRDVWLRLAYDAQRRQIQNMFLFLFLHSLRRLLWCPRSFIFLDSFLNSKHCLSVKFWRTYAVRNRLWALSKWSFLAYTFLLLFFHWLLDHNRIFCEFYFTHKFIDICVNWKNIFTLL